MRAALGAALALACGATAAAEPVLPELQLRYAASWSGTSLGQIVITLQPHGAPDCYRYESVSDPVGIVRWFYGKPREVSEFCISGGQVVPKRFEYVARDGFTLEFDTAAGKVRDRKGRARDIPAGAQDRFGLQQAVRLWAMANASAKDASAEFPMVDDERVRVYRFAITARETIEIPAGKFDTLRVERVDHKRRISRYWIAPERGWMPVKVETGKDGKVQLRMELKP
jgi:hypothetical protein